MIKRFFQIIGTAFIVAGLSDIYLLHLLETDVPAEPVNVPVTATYSTVEAVTDSQPIEITIEKQTRVYDGVALPAELVEYVEARCNEWNVRPELAFAIMKSESHGNWVYGDWSDDLQRYRSIGYFQIRDCNWGRLYDKYGIDAQTRTGNLDAGVMMIAELCNKYGPKDVCQIITSYKCGEYRGEELVAAGVVLDCVDEVMMTYAEYCDEN